jgi:hypothetical protein
MKIIHYRLIGLLLFLGMLFFGYLGFIGYNFLGFLSVVCLIAFVTSWYWWV